MKNENKKLFLGILPFCFLFALLCAIYLRIPLSGNKIEKLVAVKGKVKVPMNAKNSLLQISGEFHFTPNQFYSLYNTSDSTYAQFPGTFSETVLKSKRGFGSYGLEISGLDSSKIYLMQIGHALSSADICINSHEVTRQGQPGVDKKNEIPGIRSSHVAFRPNKDGTANLIINMSNFRNRMGGISLPLFLGSVEQISALTTSDLIFNGLMFAVVCSIAIFFFFLYFFYKDKAFIIWFVLVAFSLAIRGIFFYPHVAPIIFPNMPWQVNFIVRYITFPLPVLFFTFFLRKALNIYLKLPYWIIIIVTSIYAISTVVLPAEISSAILIYYQIFAIFCIIYLVAIQIVALVKKSELSWWILFSSLVLFLFGVYDLAISLDIIKTGIFLSHIGTLISISSLAVMILDRYAKSINTVQNLNTQITDINNSLMRFIPKRIVDLLNKDSIADVDIGDNAELKLPILSFDIREFTHISETLSPNQIFNFLNGVFAIVAPIIRKHKGIIIKYLGDGFFAIFPDGANSALSCAVEIQKTVLGKKMFTAGESSISVGIGIDLGDSILGAIGDTSRMDTVIVSNSYHVAQMLQEYTKRYSASIIISDKVFNALSKIDKHYIRPLQKIKNADGDESFLYEVYDSDTPPVREMKKYAGKHIEKALNALSDRSFIEADKLFGKALTIYPNDNIANYYKKLLEKYNGI